MATKTLPIDYPLVIPGGATFLREFRWWPNGNGEGEVPQDFTGWQGVLLIGPPGGVALFEFTESTTALTLGSDGTVRIELTPTDTAALTRPGLTYNLDLIDPDGRVLRFLRGKVLVTAGVRRAA